jgi:hypothetical protein
MGTPDDEGAAVEPTTRYTLIRRRDRLGCGRQRGRIATEMSMDLLQGLGYLGSFGFVTLLVLVGRKLRQRRRSGAFGPGLGPGLVGAYDAFHTHEKRQAMELIVEERAAEKRPEYPDGNLPELERPERK